MTEISNETALLRAFQADPGPEAFQRLADRHLPLVWSVARRVLADEPALVEDAVQLVLTDLARRAERLKPEGSLGGWLHRHTCFTASKLRRTEHRRRHRESAAAMSTPLTSSPAPDDPWRELAPHVDTALAALAETDRTAIVLRFFEGQEYRAVGQALGLSDEAARKRVDRALATLRKTLVRAGVAMPAAVLGSALAANALAAPPPGWGAGVVTAAWNQRTTAAGAGSTLLSRCAAWIGTPWLWPAVGVVMAVGGWVWWQRTGALRTAAPGAPVPAALSTPTGPPGDPLVAEITVFDVEQAQVAATLRSFVPGRDDPALWERLDAAATPAPTMSPEAAAPGAPRPVLGSVVRAASFQEAVTSGRRATLEKWIKFTYGTEFEPPEGSGDEGETTAWEKQLVGTGAEVVLGPRRADGRRQAHVKVTHHFEPPAWLHWPTRVWESGHSEGGVWQPGTQHLSLEGTVVLPPAQPRLVASGTVPPPIEASAAPPRRVLVFARFSDPAAP